MLYMLLPLHSLRPAHGGAGMAMAGMGASACPAGSFPALAVVLALFMLGYIVWTTDRLASLARARTAVANPGRNSGPAVIGGGLWRCARYDAANALQHTSRRRNPADSTTLADRCSPPGSPPAAKSR